VTALRVGVSLVQEQRWATDQHRWREADEAGFATIWTLDHLSWRSLRDGPWYAAMPLLTAAAGVTKRARLGPLVASPNFRHPVLFAKEVMTLDEISGGRVDLGLGAGAGGTSADATVLGDPDLSPRDRMQRFEDFVEMLDALLSQPATTKRTIWYAADDARMIPGCVQAPRVPFTIGANGPRGLRLAAQHAGRWVTYGPSGGATDERSWWQALHEQSGRLDEACEALDRPPDDIARMALLSLDVSWPQSSPDAWDDTAGRLAEEGFTDVVVHWPRPHDDALPGPTPATFDHIASTLASSN
jgi:alkanesulfonate monooxygenase SsuD/methylene tetrahydromethanopterin reductase-like flavin-dependent oxidoreductase (luciferase family)